MAEVPFFSQSCQFPAWDIWLFARIPKAILLAYSRQMNLRPIDTTRLDRSPVDTPIGRAYDYACPVPRSIVPYPTGRGLG